MDTSVEQGSASLVRPLLAFAGMLIVCQVIVGVLESYIELPSSMGLILVMASAMGAGGVFANRARRVMTAGEKFKFAIGATVLAIVLGVAGLWAMFAYYGVPFTAEMILFSLGGSASDMDDFKTYMPIIVAVISALNILVCYFAVGFGAKNSVKQAARVAEKLAAKGK